MDTTKVQNLIEENMGLSGLPKEAREMIISKLGENILRRCMVAVFEAIPEGSREEWKRLAESGDYKKSYEYAKEKIGDINSLVERETKAEIEEFKRLSAAA